MYRCTECGAGGLDVKPTFSPYGMGVCRCGSKAFKMRGQAVTPPLPQPVLQPPWSYTLTESEIDHVEKVARGAIARSKGRGGVERDGGSTRESTRFERNANGFAGEVTVARVLGDDEWLPSIVPVKFSDLPDAAGLSEARTTAPNRRLIIYPRDKGHRPYTLVWGTRFTLMTAKGWLYGREGKDRRYWEENVPNPNYFVPHTKLRSMESLAALLDR